MFRFSIAHTARLLVLACTAMLMTPVFAHDGHPAMTGFASGLAHPFSGLDHLLAMLAIGIWAAQHKRRAVWMLPAMFLAMMGLGAVLAVAGMHFPGAEAGIAGSLAMLGLLIAFAVRLPILASAGLVSLFALLHGYAHGIESPPGASIALYGAGFMLATGILHLVGIMIGRFADAQAVRKVVRFGGVGIAAVGVYLLAGMA